MVLKKFDYIVIVFTFLKTFKYEFINCKQSETNMCLVSLKLFIARTILCDIVQTCTMCSNNYNNNCLIRYSYHTTIR